MREGNSVRLGIVALAFVAAAVAGCQSVGASDKEGMLAAAGFQRHQADTPAKLAKLQSMPQYRLVFAQRKKGPVYIFADAQGCQCAWVGSPDDCAAYQQMRNAQQIAQMQVAAAEIDEASALDFATAWGPEIPGW